MYAADPDPTPRRTDHRLCPGCEATPAGCESNRWLRAQWCCTTCTGNHDQENQR